MSMRNGIYKILVKLNLPFKVDKNNIWILSVFLRKETKFMLNFNISVMLGFGSKSNVTADRKHSHLSIVSAAYPSEDWPSVNANGKLP